MCSQVKLGDGCAKSVCVIGAGPAGLATLKCLLAEGLAAEVFEMADHIGGMWVYTDNADARSACYSTLTTNTYKSKTAFSDFPMPEDFPLFPHHSQVLQYLEDYATAFGLHEHIRLNSEVTFLAQEKDGRWRIELHGGKCCWYDAVAVCTGHHWDPIWPTIPGLQDFNGAVLHSKQYRRPEQAKGQRVLIVGGGVSGRDLARQLAATASHVTMSSTHRAGGASSLSHLDSQLQVDSDDLNGAIAKGKVVKVDGKRVMFEDGSSEEVDMIFCCTGYKITLPFFDSEIEQSCRVCPDVQVVGLWHHIFVPSKPRLALIGFVTTYGSLFPICEMQAKVFARSLVGAFHLPSEDTMCSEVSAWAQQFSQTNEKIYRPMNQGFWEYLRELRELIEAGPTSSWTCRACDEINKASRAVCNNCTLERPHGQKAAQT